MPHKMTLSLHASTNGQWPVAEAIFSGNLKLDFWMQKGADIVVMVTWMVISLQEKDVLNLAAFQGEKYTNH